MKTTQQPTLKPRPTDAVLGGSQPSPRHNDVVLGGTAVLNRPKRRLTSTKGDTVDTPLTDAHTLQICSQLNNNKFASDLHKKSQSQPLSESQLVWAHTFAIQFLEDKVLPRKQVGQPILTQIFQMLTGAGEKLKRPKIQLIDEESRQIITLYLAGTRSKYPNTIQVVCGESWYGRIECLPLINSAQFVQVQLCPDWVAKLIERFAENPAAVAAEYGRITGNCSFCIHPLTDERSTTVGYGPVCARNYQLPWGDK